MSVTLIDLPFAIISSIAGSPGFVAGIFTSRLGRSTSSWSRTASATVRLGVVGQARVDLHRDEAVAPAGLLPHGSQEVAGVADVLAREPNEDLLRVVSLGENLAQLLVVGASLGERLLEDRRVRRHADDARRLHQPGERAAFEQIAREVVDPYALALVRQALERSLGHGFLLGRGFRRAGGARRASRPARRRFRG